jgi:molecular chaperone DnaK
MTTIIGIDLGTTNTVVADGNGIRAIHGKRQLPSVVAFPPNGKTLIGDLARARRAIDPQHTISSSKRLIGDPPGRTISEIQQRFPGDIIITEAGAPAYRTRAGLVSPEQVAALLIHEAVVGTGLDPDELCAVVTVPAAYSQASRASVGRAARQAGLTQVLVVDEPIATAVAHEGLVGSHLSAIYDIGGGTFDFAVVERTPDRTRILAHGGDLFLGGDDFDHALARHCAQEIYEHHQWDIGADRDAFDRLVGQCERAKIALSMHAQVAIDLSAVEPDLPIAQVAWPLTRSTLERVCGGLVRQTFVICDEVLRNAGVNARNVDAVFMAGGTTLLPIVERTLAGYFGKPPSFDVSPLDVVAIGAYATANTTFG